MRRVLDDFYEDGDRPAGFTSPHFVQEYLLSYKLLFAASRGARKSWRQEERMKASDAAGSFCDPILEELCGSKERIFLEGRHGQLSYSTTNDLAVFAQRLQVIQDEILRQQPNRLSALWNDGREPLRWYTFWAVLVMGIVGLVLAISQ